MIDLFYFLRHGQTDWNAQGLLMGQKDIPVNERGKKQAEEAAKVLAGYAITSLCHSPLSRATETAQIVASQCPCNLYPMKDLMERSWGIWEGSSLSEEHLLNIQDVLPKGAESFDDFRKRVLHGFEQALACPPSVLLVSHGGVFRVICNELEINHESLPNALVIQVVKRLGKWELRACSKSSTG